MKESCCESPAVELPAFPHYQEDDLAPQTPNTISDGPDSGANDCLAMAFAWVKRHKTTERAALNLEVANSSSAKVNLGGHGNDGFIETGSGKKGAGDYKTNFITTWNQHYWEAWMRAIRSHPATLLSITSCHTGAGEQGADLLYQMAQVTEKSVRGRTGFTYCNRRYGVNYEKGSTWQVATPHQRPIPISAPSAHLDYGYDTKRIRVVVDKVAEEIPIDDFIEIKVESYRGVNRTRSIRAIEPDLLKSAVISFFGSRPYALPGIPLATVTARATVTFDFRGTTQSIRYNIFNDRMLANEDGLSAHYVKNDVIDFY